MTMIATAAGFIQGYWVRLAVEFTVLVIVSTIIQKRVKNDVTSCYDTH